MSIVKMKKLSLLLVRSQEDELLRELMLLGCVEVSEPEPADVEVLARVDESALPTLNTQKGVLLGAVRVLDKYAPEKKKLFAPKPQVGLDEFLDGQGLDETLAVAEHIRDLDEQLRRVSAEEGRLTASLEALSPWESLKLPLELTATRSCAVITGTLPPASELSEVEGELALAAEHSALIRVSDSSEQHCVLIACLKSETDEALAALRARGFAPASFGGAVGTAAENCARIRERLTELAREKAAISESVRAEAGRRGALNLCADRMDARIAQAEAAEKLLCSDSVAALSGWYPAEVEERLFQLLSGYCCAWQTRDPEPEEYPDVPVKLKNNRLTEPLNMVTDMYSTPAYDGIDPNPLMAPFFILFYGIMMADMGYGLLMMAASLFVLKKMRPRDGMHNFAALLGLGGISTFIFGAVTGSFFGDFIPQVAKIINPETTLTSLPYLFTPLNNTMEILIGSLCLGMVQTITGMVISVVDKFKKHDALGALFDEVAWWLILAGAAMAIFGVGSVGGVPVVLCLGILDLVVGQFVIKKSLFGALGGLFGAVYNGVTGIFSDVLSYSRLMALMLAGSIISTVFNTLGAVPGNIVVFVVISMLGNALNFALNLLGCYVHDLRLQCLEFFGRFYKDGGRKYRPLSIKTKYVDVIKEEV